LNRLLKERLNPNQGQSEWAVAFGSNGQRLEVRVGDRLMVIKNNYQLNVSNGDIGKLISIHKDFLRIRIHGIGKIPDSSVDVPKNVAPLMLKLAYAVTVHRCQGEEFETVIFPLVREHGRMLQRNLFYTAITRARSKVWVLGDTESVAKAVSNDKVVQRNTQLRHLITQGLRVAHQAKKD
jgi:exodeoxyribonuclease V alpha subunit